MHLSIYIYIYTNLLSTSIYGYQKKEQEISRITAREKKKNIIGQKERKSQTRHTSWKKIKRYAISWSKEN